MKQEDIHLHSEAAFSLLDTYKIGNTAVRIWVNCFGMFEGVYFLAGSGMGLKGDEVLHVANNMTYRIFLKLLLHSKTIAIVHGIWHICRHELHSSYVIDDGFEISKKQLRGRAFQRNPSKVAKEIWVVLDLKPTKIF